MEEQLIKFVNEFSNELEEMRASLYGTMSKLENKINEIAKNYFAFVLQFYKFYLLTKWYKKSKLFNRIFIEIF